MRNEVDNRQLMIVFQNSMSHATNIMIHNSKGEKIDPVEVVKLGWRITKAVLDPSPIEELLKKDK